MTIAILKVSFIIIEPDLLKQCFTAFVTDEIHIIAVDIPFDICFPERH